MARHEAGLRVDHVVECTYRTYNSLHGAVCTNRTGDMLFEGSVPIAWTRSLSNFTITRRVASDKALVFIFSLTRVILGLPFRVYQSIDSLISSYVVYRETVIVLAQQEVGRDSVQVSGS
jgi:hypothetical protein